MLSEIKTDYDSIIKKFALKPSSLKKEEAKQQLLNMAKKRKSKPELGTNLHHSLRLYTFKSSKSYDPKFDEQIRKLAPNWFLSNKILIAISKKNKLLNMAKKGLKRPERCSKIYNALCSYTSKKNSCYDPQFDKEIRKIAPNWFVSLNTQRLENKKKKLLNLALNKKTKPSWKSSLGSALITYTSKSSKVYDEHFTKQIRKIAPNWLIHQRIVIANENKKKILILAKSKDIKPNQTTLGRAIKSYTCKSSDSYDPVFDKNIRKLRPDWFIKIIKR